MEEVSMSTVRIKTFQLTGVFTRFVDGLLETDRVDQARKKSQSLTFPYALN
jgi:hypothetical protein